MSQHPLDPKVLCQQPHDFASSAKHTFAHTTAALNRIASHINGDFNRVCNILLNCKGRVVVIGMGKSGHIAKKIAATLASTGTPAFFVHPGEASHGDLGMITQYDAVLALSNSGNSPEITALLPTFVRQNTPIISLCGNAQSTLATSSTVTLILEIEREACPLDLAPTTSTTAALVMGDAIAVALLQARGFTRDDFAHFHPGGSLGKKLLLKVQDVMHQDNNMPKVVDTDTVTSALKTMTEKGFGMTSVVNTQEQLCGIFTDGDLRRCVTQGVDISKAYVRDVMTPSPLTIQSESLAATALNIMEKHKITTLIVTDAHHNTKGVIHMHDLLKEGFA